MFYNRYINLLCTYKQVHKHIYLYILTNILLYIQISKTKLIAAIIQVISIILGREFPFT
jgi:hypothetical protein